MSEPKKQLNLEEMIARINQIQMLIENKQVTLTDSIPLLEEAYKLKTDVEKILTEIENKLITLTKSEE